MANTQTEGESESVKELMQGVLTDINQQGYMAIENEDIEGFYSLVSRSTEDIKNLLQMTDHPVPSVTVTKTNDEVVHNNEPAPVIFDNKKYAEPISMDVLDELYPTMDKHFDVYLGKNNVVMDGSRHIRAMMFNEESKNHVDIRTRNNEIQLLRLLFLNGGLVNETFVFKEFFGTETPSENELSAMKSTLAAIRNRTKSFGCSKYTGTKTMTTNWPVAVQQLSKHEKGQERRYSIDRDLIVGMRRIKEITEF